MKNALPLLFLLAHTATAGTAPEWIMETRLEFITTGRFQTPSDGSDLLVVDKAAGSFKVLHAQSKFLVSRHSARTRTKRGPSVGAVPSCTVTVCTRPLVVT